MLPKAVSFWDLGNHYHEYWLTQSLVFSGFYSCSIVRWAQCDDPCLFVAQNDGRGGPMGRGRGRGFDDRGRGPGGPGGPGGRFEGGGGFKEDTTFCVPSDKCGLVIGKGGRLIVFVVRVLIMLYCTIL